MYPYFFIVYGYYTGTEAIVWLADNRMILPILEK